MSSFTFARRTLGQGLFTGDAVARQRSSFDVTLLV
jgi:hypothetical protein